MPETDEATTIAAAENEQTTTTMPENDEAIAVVVAENHQTITIRAIENDQTITTMPETDEPTAVVERDQTSTITATENDQTTTMPENDETTTNTSAENDQSTTDAENDETTTITAAENDKNTTSQTNTAERDEPTTTTTNKRNNYRRFSDNKSHYRLLCPLFIAGGIIGKNGTIVRLLQQATKARIFVDEPVYGSDFRVVHVLSNQTRRKHTIDGLDYEISFAQHALVRVFERVLKVEQDMEGDFTGNGNGSGSGGSVRCRLLVEPDHIGYLVGTKGSRIKKMESLTGTRVRVRDGDHLPSCAHPDDAMILISGDSFAVKKAILAVTCSLEYFRLLYHARMNGSKPFIKDPLGEFSDSRNLLRCQSSPTSNSSTDYAWRGPPMPSEADMTSTLDLNMMMHQVEFQLICSNNSIGSLIGKGGVNVKTLEKETGASISVGAPVDKSDDHVITVSAYENIASRYSSAQSAVIRVFAKCTKIDSGEGSAVTARLMVTSDQVGCLIGKGGSVVSQIRRATSTSIWVLSGEQIPKCPSALEHVVEITGHFENVQDALLNVTRRLRDHLLGTAENGDLSFVETFRNPSPFYQSKRSSNDLDQQATLTESMGHLGLSNSSDNSPSPWLWASRTVDESNRRDDTYPGRGSLEPMRSTVVTNTTLKIVVSKLSMKSICGENEKNLSRLREISGAVIVVHEPLPGTSDGTVIISGTPDQSQAAQSLLHAFIHRR